MLNIAELHLTAKIAIFKWHECDEVELSQQLFKQKCINWNSQCLSCAFQSTFRVNSSGMVFKSSEDTYMQRLLPFKLSNRAVDFVIW